MKLLLVILTCLIFQRAFSQCEDTITIDLTLKFTPATVTLIKDTSKITYPNLPRNCTRVTYKELDGGTYRIEVSGAGQKTEIIDSFSIIPGQLVVLVPKVNGPCLYDHPPDYVPVCSHNHRDSILPILYGLVILTKEDKGKVHLGGCITTGCDPQYYCKIHKVKF